MCLNAALNDNNNIRSLLHSCKLELFYYLNFDSWIFLNNILATYDDNFFEQLDGVANALDNIDASKKILFFLSY